MADLSAQIEDLLVSRLTEHSNSRDRTHQSRLGYIGPSDLGFCRQKAVLIMRNAPRDVPPENAVDTWAADVGTAIHEWIEDAFDGYDGVLTSKDIGRLSATFPRSNAVVRGTPDLIVPEHNLLLDVKTKNGLAYVQRNGPDRNNRYQRHTYALGAIEAGLLTDDETLKVGNAFFDRSGSEKRPFVTIEPFDPSLTDEIDSWIEDVIYARLHEEDAMRDIPAERCEAMCEFFTVCRGVLEDTHDPVLIENPDTIQAIDTYVEGMALERQGKRLKAVAKDALRNVNGSDGRFQVRWTHVERGKVEAYDRAAYDKLDVRPLRKGRAAAE